MKEKNVTPFQDGKSSVCTVWLTGEKRNIYIYIYIYIYIDR